MAITYVNDLRLSEMGTGDNSGTWGTVTNTNLELIGEALGFGTEAITTNADTHASTIADGSTDPVRAMYVKYTGTLDSACTITIGPNTVNKFYYIENATSGSQNIIISQGSGANVTIPAGDVKAVYLDGAGSGAAVTDAFASLNVGVLSTATADNNPQITLVSTATNASQGPVLDLYRNSSSPADNDLGGAIKFNAENDAGEKTQYQIIQAYMPDVSNGSEDGAFQHYVMKDGTSIQRLEHSPTETVFNQDSADVNFRIESDNHDNIFFVDGGNDGIGIGNSTIIDWSTNYPGLQMGQAGVLYGHKSSNQMTFGMNWGVTTGNVYIADGIASRMVMDTSKISFDTSASGSAAGSITGINTLQMTSSGSVFNEDSADMDFRVESNGNANMLFVDGGNDHVNIGTSTDLGGVFNVSGATASKFFSTDRHLMSLVSTEAGASDGPRLVIQRDSSSPADGDQLGILEFYGENDADEAIEYARINASIIDASDGTEDGAFAINTRIAGANVNRLYMPPTETVFNENSSDIDFRVESNGNTHMLYVDGGNDRVAIGSTGYTSTSDLNLTGKGLSLKNDLNGNSDNWSVIQNDASVSTANLKFGTGNGNVEFTHGSGLITNPNLDGYPSVFNETSKNCDFRVESNGKTHMLVVDAGTDAVGINNSTPNTYPANTQTGTATDGGQFRIGGSVGAICASDTGNELAWTRSGLNYISSPNGGFNIRAGSSGGVSLASGGTSWGSASDERLKTLTGDIENAIDKVKTLRTKMGRYNDDSQKISHPFLIAQDVQAVLPEAVSVIENDPNVEDKTGVTDKLYLNYTDVIPLLTAALKESIAKNEALETRVAALES